MKIAPSSGTILGWDGLKFIQISSVLFLITKDMNQSCSTHIRSHHPQAAHVPLPSILSCLTQMMELPSALQTLVMQAEWRGSSFPCLLSSANWRVQGAHCACGVVTVGEEKGYEGWVNRVIQEL
jgi:hypothetical protein